MDEQVTPIGEDNLPSWMRILIPHGLDAFVPRGCVTLFMGLPWWLDILNALGMAPVLVWPRVMEYAGPPGLAGVILSDVVCIYPLLIPVCVVASTLLFKRNHRSLSVVFTAINLVIGLIVVGVYVSGLVTN